MSQSHQYTPKPPLMAHTHCFTVHITHFRSFLSLRSSFFTQIFHCSPFFFYKKCLFLIRLSLLLFQSPPLCSLCFPLFFSNPLFPLYVGASPNVRRRRAPPIVRRLSFVPGTRQAWLAPAYAATPPRSSPSARRFYALPSFCYNRFF